MRALEWCIREGLISGQNELDTLCSAASIAFGSKLHLGKLRCLGHFGARFDPSCGLPPRRELLLGCQVFLRIWMLRLLHSIARPSVQTRVTRVTGNPSQRHQERREITQLGTVRGALLHERFYLVKPFLKNVTFFAIFLLQPTLPVSETAPQGRACA